MEEIRSRYRACARATIALRVVAFTSLFASSLALAQVTNAPVAPDTIYVGRRGAATGISVIDLNGFGASTGNPAYDPTNPIVEGNSNYPNNPNVKLQGSLLHPPLVPGTTTLDGGSAGVFTLTKNSALDDLVVRAPSISSISDMMLGHALDAAYNNGPAPFGCQAGGGNLCAITALKVLEIALDPNGVLVPAGFGGTLQQTLTGVENPISWAPHPNPPPLRFPASCLVPWIGGQEPTSILSTLAAPVGPGLTNLLAPGDPFGNPALGVPPSGLLASAQNAFFLGVGPPQSTIPACLPYGYRQQIGHYLYVTDRERGEVVVLNSNTMRVLQRIEVAGPTELAMGPTLDFLAVTQRAHDQVAFIDIVPGSPTFHQVVQVTAVGDEPSGIAWDPGNEDLLVCNEGSDSVSVIHAGTLTVRKTVTGRVDRPFAVAISQRQANFGLTRNVYFAYILDRAGRVSLFESGPNTINGWGYDDIVGRTPFHFASPKAIQLDPQALDAAVWIVHDRQLASDGTQTGLGGGAVTRLLLAGTQGVIPLDLSTLFDPQMRAMSFVIDRSIGSDQLSGSPYDLAFDDLSNLGSLPDGAATYNGKRMVRNPGPNPVATNDATFMFLPVKDTASGIEAVDVIRLSDGTRLDTNAFQPGVQSIPADGASIVMDYFRQ